MQTRKLGSSDLDVSVVGLGTNNFGMRLDLEATRAVLDTAIEVGVTLIDTADVYGATQSESFIGEVLGARRHRVVLATKFGMRRGDTPCASRAYIMAAVEASLTRLKTDYIDLYQQHRFDPATPMEETLEALNDLVQQGKVRHIGSSNFTGWQTVDADWIARTHGWARFVACQNEYSLANRQVEAELIPAMAAKGLGLLPFYPLGGGLFTGKSHRGEPPPAGTRLAGAQAGGRFLNDANLALVERLTDFAQSRGHTILELAFAWLLSQPVLSSVIAGATTPAQVQANARAADWVMTGEEVAAVRAILEEPA